VAASKTKLNNFQPKKELHKWSRSAWSKPWHAGRMRPADSFCAAREHFGCAGHFTKS